MDTAVKIIKRFLKPVLLFRSRKAVFLFCSALLVLTDGCAAPASENTIQDVRDQDEKNAGTAEPVKDESGKKELGKEDISSWLDAELTGGESEVTEEDVKKWEKDNQSWFYKSWRKMVLKQIKGWEEAEDYGKTAEDIARSCSIYKKICGSKKEVENLLQNAQTVSVLAKDNENVKARYSIDILSDRDECSFNTYYIERQLETVYSDNLAGKLQKEAESYQQKEYLDWLAYDVDYWMDEAVCGDTCQMVIRTETDEPFESAGAYYLAYINTGETMMLGDSRGFRQEVPVCQMLGDGSIVENDFSQYISNIDTCFSLCLEIEQILKTEKSELPQENMAAGTDMAGSSLNPADDEDDLGDYGQYYIFCDSNERFLEDWDFDDMDSYALCLARNEIYARHGRLFSDKEIQAYFDSMPWYVGTVAPDDFDDGVFNQYEKANLKKIAELESGTAE